MFTEEIAKLQSKLSQLISEQRAKNLEAKLASIVTDVCNHCLGTGSLQYCGGEACPECDGTGKPPQEVYVYKCLFCQIQSLDKDQVLLDTCSLFNKPHAFYLETIYSKEGQK